MSATENAATRLICLTAEERDAILSATPSMTNPNEYMAFTNGMLYALSLLTGRNEIARMPIEREEAVV